MKKTKLVIATVMCLLFTLPAFAGGKGKLGRNIEHITVNGTVPVSEYATKGHHKFCPMNSIIKTTNENYQYSPFKPKGKLGK